MHFYCSLKQVEMEIGVIHCQMTHQISRVSITKPDNDAFLEMHELTGKWPVIVSLIQQFEWEMYNI